MDRSTDDAESAVIPLESHPQSPASYASMREETHQVLKEFASFPVWMLVHLVDTLDPIILARLLCTCARFDQGETEKVPPHTASIATQRLAFR